MSSALQPGHLQRCKFERISSQACYDHRTNKITKRLTPGWEFDEIVWKNMAKKARAALLKQETSELATSDIMNQKNMNVQGWIRIEFGSEHLCTDVLLIFDGLCVGVVQVMWRVLNEESHVGWTGVLSGFAYSSVILLEISRESDFK